MIYNYAKLRTIEKNVLDFLQLFTYFLLVFTVFTFYTFLLNFSCIVILDWFVIVYYSSHQFRSDIKLFNFKSSFFSLFSKRIQLSSLVTRFYFIEWFFCLFFFHFLFANIFQFPFTLWFRRRIDVVYILSLKTFNIIKENKRSERDALRNECVHSIFQYPVNNNI